MNDNAIFVKTLTVRLALYFKRHAEHTNQSSEPHRSMVVGGDRPLHKCNHTCSICGITVGVLVLWSRRAGVLLSISCLELVGDVFTFNHSCACCRAQFLLKISHLYLSIGWSISKFNRNA